MRIVDGANVLRLQLKQQKGYFRTQFDPIPLLLFSSRSLLILLILFGSLRRMLRRMLRRGCSFVVLFQLSLLLSRAAVLQLPSLVPSLPPALLPAPPLRLVAVPHPSLSSESAAVFPQLVKRTVATFGAELVLAENVTKVRRDGHQWTEWCMSYHMSYHLHPKYLHPKYLLTQSIFSLPTAPV